MQFRRKTDISANKTTFETLPIVNLSISRMIVYANGRSEPFRSLTLLLSFVSNCSSIQNYTELKFIYWNFLPLWYYSFYNSITIIIQSVCQSKLTSDRGFQLYGAVFLESDNVLLYCPSTDHIHHVTSQRGTVHMNLNVILKRNLMILNRVTVCLSVYLYIRMSVTGSPPKPWTVAMWKLYISFWSSFLGQRC
jgi:hypothetical protein